MQSVCSSKSQRSLCISRTNVGLCIYHLFVWWNLTFLHTSQWITLPAQSCLALYSFYANLLHSLIMWLMVSSLSPHNYTLLRGSHTSVSRWFLTEVWMTANVLKSPGLFSVFWPIVIMLLIGWFLLVLLFSRPLVLYQYFCDLTIASI